MKCCVSYECRNPKKEKSCSLNGYPFADRHLYGGIWCFIASEKYDSSDTDYHNY